MANEISVSLNYTVQNPATGGGFASPIRVNSQFNQNTQLVNAEVVSVPTTNTSYTFSNVTTFGWGYFQNLDSTNYVQLGLLVSAAFVPFCKLKPGEIALFRLQPGMAFQMQANTASVNVWYQIAND